MERTQDDKLASAKADLDKSIKEHVFSQSERPALEQNNLQQNNYGVLCPNGVDATGWCIGFPHPVESEKPATQTPTITQTPAVTPIARLVVPYTPSPDGTMMVHVTVNGMPTDALLDSGSSGVSVNFSDFGIQKTSEGTFALANGAVQHTGTGSAVICMGQRSTNGRGLRYDVCLKANATDTPTAAIPLIGQSFIGLFRTMSINRRESHDNSSSIGQDHRSSSIVKIYSLAHHTLVEALTKCHRRSLPSASSHPASTWSTRVRAESALTPSASTHPKNRSTRLSRV